ncbi:MAG: hypothetical protein U0804_15685 [Gemmataceae bacterium]
MFRTRLSLTWLESRDVPDGGGVDPTVIIPPPGGSNPPIYDPGNGSGIDPSQGPIGGGTTNNGGTPP